MKIGLKEKFTGLFLLSLLLTNCAGKTTKSTNSTSETALKQDDTLTIWWTRSYYLQEDEAIKEIVAAWQSQTGKKIDFSLIDQDSILRDTVNALKAENPPDIIFAYRTNDSLGPRWAWDDQLADVSDVVEPLKDAYSPAALQSVYYYNNVARERSTYAVPLKQLTVHIHYWRDLLAEAGMKEEDIPTEWDAFWQFWKQVQDNLRLKGREDFYAFGFPMSGEASDTHFAFEHILEAYDVQLLDEDGNLRLGDPQMRQSIVTALKWYTSFYKEGYVPPEANNWTNRSNNVEFLNQKVSITINPTLSIPVSQREEEDIYYNRIATLGFPNEPDGERLKPMVAVKQLVLFASSPNQKAAKNFLSYLVQPENLGPYLEESLGRFFPVMPKLASAPFWKDPADPHISKATQQFQGETRSNYQSLNLAYATVQSENVWGRAIERIIIDGVSPEKAADDALARIQAILTEWDG